MAAHETKEVILRYWKAWQSGDWAVMRSCLTDSLDFGGRTVSADDFTEMCKAGVPWKDVEMLDSLFGDGHGAILYEGTETRSGQRIRVAEFIRVSAGTIASSNACFGSGAPPEPS